MRTRVQHAARTSDPAKPASGAPPRAPSRGRTVGGLLLLEAAALGALVPRAVSSADGSGRLALIAALVLILASELVALRAWWSGAMPAASNGPRAAGPDNEPTGSEDPATAPAPEPVGGASELLVSLARRNQALLHRQLARLDEMEAGESDPTTLAGLFAVDHLATRMRRNAESLLILAGEDSARRTSRPVALSEVIRGAVAEIEDYGRIDVSVQGDADLAGRAVVDVVHLLAEILENAASFSPPDSRVAVHGARVRDGYVITVSDRGVGLDGAQVEHVNARLASYRTSDDLEANAMLGFRVVRRLAARHDLGVRLVSQVDHGTVVTIDLPTGLLAGIVSAPVVPAADLADAGTPAVSVASGSTPSTAAASVGVPRHYFPDGVVPERYAAAVLPAPGTAAELRPAEAVETAGAVDPVEPAGAVEHAAPTDPSEHADDLTLDGELILDFEAQLASSPPNASKEPAPEDGQDALPALNGSFPLAQRVPQHHLVPQMRGDHAPTLPSAGAAEPEPERSRSLLAAYSTGLSMGRADIPDHAGGAGEHGNAEHA